MAWKRSVSEWTVVLVRRHQEKGGGHRGPVAFPSFGEDHLVTIPISGRSARAVEDCASPM
jgi:hypothetical protein